MHGSFLGAFSNKLLGSTSRASGCAAWVVPGACGPKSSLVLLLCVLWVCVTGTVGTTGL